MKTNAYMESTDDSRTSNALRHKYRVLNDAEKQQMAAVKDAGIAFLNLISTQGASRETSLAKTKIEEAVMWAVKDVTK